MKDITMLVNEMQEDRLEGLLALLGEEEIEISEQPHTGLVMMTVNDSFASAFHPGEVLVTQARVRIRDVEGWAMVAGEEPRRALVKAAVDAVVQSPQLNLLKQRVMSFLAGEQRIQDAARAREEARIAATRVDFDLMPGA